MVTMSLIQRNRLGAVGTKSGPPGPSEVLKRTIFGQNGPFLPLFGRFLELGGSICAITVLGGSIWTITVLDEQSIPLRCSGHPTSLYFEKNVPHENGPWKFRANGRL